MDKKTEDSLNRLEEITVQLDEIFVELSNFSMDTNEEIRFSSLRAIYDTDWDLFFNTIEKCFYDDDVLVRTESIDLLGFLLQRNYSKEIFEKLSDPEVLVRSAAIIAVGEIGLTEYYDFLKGLKDSVSEHEKVRICYSLYLLGDKSYLQEFLNMLKSENYQVRCATANLSFKLTTEDNAPILLAALKEALAIEQTIAARSSIESAISIIEK